MVTVQIPDRLYHRLERVAEVSRRTIGDVITQLLEASVPLLPDHLPDTMRAELLALEKLNDDELWQTFRSAMKSEWVEQHQILLRRNSSGLLTEEERGTLAQFRQAADRLMLRKAYAAVLLKWRGHRLPALTELEAPTRFDPLNTD